MKFFDIANLQKKEETGKYQGRFWQIVNVKI